MEISAEILAALLPAAGAAAAVWINLNTKIATMAQRLHHLEQERDEMRILMKEVRQAIEEIRVLIAQR